MKTFVEIGSCYYHTLAHLCNKGWRGIVVEPQKEALDKIPDYDNLVKVEGAVTTQFETLELTRFKPEMWDKLPDQDYIGMASFIETHAIHESHESVLEKIEVGCVPFNFLIEQLGITTIDFLKIDIEGLDFDVLKSIDFEKFDIKFIQIEYDHIDEVGYTLDDMVDFLRNHNYHTEVYTMPLDIIAIKI